MKRKGKASQLRVARTAGLYRRPALAVRARASQSAIPSEFAGVVPQRILRVLSAYKVAGKKPEVQVSWGKKSQEPAAAVYWGYWRAGRASKVLRTFCRTTRRVRVMAIMRFNNYLFIAPCFPPPAHRLLPTRHIGFHHLLPAPQPPWTPSSPSYSLWSPAPALRLSLMA